MALYTYTFPTSPSETYIAQTDECHWVYSTDIENIGIASALGCPLQESTERRNVTVQVVYASAS